MQEVTRGKYATDWERLLSGRRVRLDEDGGVGVTDARRSDDGRSPFEIDYERVVFSAPFRSLARKTQVHPFAEVDWVHNRLTHSLEVASVASSLARRIADFLVERGDVASARVADLCWIVQAAGLAHDIGNPAYGHSGEEAIQSWAAARRLRMSPPSAETDFLVFDGNAQAFRLLSRGDVAATAYFHFTLASLGALVKHPRLASSFADSPGGARKLAAFTSEEAIFRRVWEELGLVDAGGSFRRHPLSYLAEAADDICYRILDFEDAVALRIFPEEDIAALFSKVVAPEDRANAEGKSLPWFRARAIHNLVDAFTAEFKAHYDEIMSGRMDGELKDCLAGDLRDAFDEIKRRYEVLFANHRKVIAEIGSYGQFAQILDHYWNFVTFVHEQAAPPAFGELPPLCRQLVRLAWDDAFYDANRARGRDWWAHAALDFVSGMTDDYINALARRLGK